MRVVDPSLTKVGAVCGKAARTVLCGGRSAMSVPTAMAARVHHAVRGATAAWPLAARAQQPAGHPLIGLLSPPHRLRRRATSRPFARVCASSAIWKVATLPSSSAMLTAHLDRLPDL